MNKRIWISKNCLLSCVIADACLLCSYHVDVVYKSQIGQEMKHAHRGEGQELQLERTEQKSTNISCVVSFE